MRSLGKRGQTDSQTTFIPLGSIVKDPRSSLWLYSCEFQVCVNLTTAVFQRPVLFSSLAQMLIPSSS